MDAKRTPCAEIARLIQKLKGESVPNNSEYWVQIFKYEPRTAQCTSDDKKFFETCSTFADVMKHNGSWVKFSPPTKRESGQSYLTEEQLAKISFCADDKKDENDKRKRSSAQVIQAFPSDFAQCVAHHGTKADLRGLGYAVSPVWDSQKGQYFLRVRPLSPIS